MNTEEVAQKVVELVRKQAWHEALDTLYDKNIVSVEAHASDGESPQKQTFIFTVKQPGRVTFAID